MNTPSREGRHALPALASAPMINLPGPVTPR